MPDTTAIMNQSRQSRCGRAGGYAGIIGYGADGGSGGGARPTWLSARSISCDVSPLDSRKLMRCDMEELCTLGSSRNETAFATISARGALGPIRSDGSDMPCAKRARPAS
mgnify:CR=1 FL=1